MKPPKAFSRDEINDKSRAIIQNCLSHLDTNLNILVLGGKDSGKDIFVYIAIVFYCWEG